MELVGVDKVEDTQPALKVVRASSNGMERNFLFMADLLWDLLVVQPHYILY
jgi:hypothetical protein